MSAQGQVAWTTPTLHLDHNRGCGQYPFLEFVLSSEVTLNVDVIVSTTEDKYDDDDTALPASPRVDIIIQTGRKEATERFIVLPLKHKRPGNLESIQLDSWYNDRLEYIRKECERNWFAIT
jgi:hypothetical protein